MKERNYECRYCGSTFVYEDRFLRHECKQMKREKEFQSPLGQQAWLLYQDWMRANRRHVPKGSSFLHSKLYGSFIRFAQFVKDVKLPDAKVFIRLMVDRDIPPAMWTAHEIYAQYLEHYDRCGKPLNQAKVTIDTLFELAEEHNCDISDVFDYLQPTEVTQLIRQRVLSPWILLNSRKFMGFYINKVTGEERVIMDAIIRPDYWRKKFSSNEKDYLKMKTFVSELNL